MLIANNVIWSRFSKQPWWPCLTVIPNEAASSKEYVPHNQASGARMRLYYFLTHERGEVSKSADFVTQFEATVWPKREDFYGSPVASDSPPVENPVNPSHLLAPDPNKAGKPGKKNSQKYLQAIPAACEEIEERERVRKKAIKTMGHDRFKRLKIASNGWLNCRIKYTPSGHKKSADADREVEAFVHRYSMKMKKWLLTPSSKKVNGKGQWVDLRKCDKVTTVKDYDDDSVHSNPMEEDVVVPEGYVDYSCKYCKLSMLDEEDNFLPSSMLKCHGCKMFVHGDTCLDPPLPPKIMDNFYAPPELIEEKVRSGRARSGDLLIFEPPYIIPFGALTSSSLVPSLRSFRRSARRVAVQEFLL